MEKDAEERKNAKSRGLAQPVVDEKAITVPPTAPEKMTTTTAQKPADPGSEKSFIDAYKFWKWRPSQQNSDEQSVTSTTKTTTTNIVERK